MSFQNGELEIKSLNFTSNFRSSGSLANPQFIISEQLVNVRAVKLKSATIPLSFYTFDDRNNKIYFSENGGATLFTSIPNGIYTSSTLPTVLKSAFENSGVHIYTVSYSAITNKISYSVSAEFPTGSETFAFKQGANNAYYELGITNDDLNATAGAITPSEVIDLSGVNSIQLLSSIKATSVVGKPYNIVGTIGIDKNQNEVLYYQDDSSDYISTNLNYLSEMNFLLYDERFRPLTPLKDYSITLCFLTE